jgi:hypothetical protein
VQLLIAGVDGVGLREMIVSGNHLQLRREAMLRDQASEQFPGLHLHLQ